MEGSMLEEHNWRHCSAVARLPVVTIASMVLLVGTVAAQDPSLAAYQSGSLGNAALPLRSLFGAGLSLAPTASAGGRQWQASDAAAFDLASSAFSAQKDQVPFDGTPRRIKLG